jgi:hypothetical protein
MNIIAKHYTPAAAGTRAAQVIMVKRDTCWHPYVTGIQCFDEKTGLPENSWFWGHYFETEAEATKDFNARVARYS